MRHCSPDELIDVVEGARSETSLPHLSTCAACRQQLIEVRAVLLEVSAVPVPEPSAAQMARLSARVREAVAAEGDRSRPSWWTSGPSWAWGLPIAAVAVLTFTILGPARNRPATVVVPIAQTAAGAAGRSGAAPVDVDDPASARRQLDAPDDPSLGLMFDLAAVVDLDSDPLPVLAMGPSALDDAVGDLSPDEQHEFERLLKEAIERPGA